MRDSDPVVTPQRFPIRIGRRSQLVLLLFGVRPANAYVDLGDDELDAHFGFFRFRTPRTRLPSAPGVGHPHLRGSPLQSPICWRILNRMVQYAIGRLDASFAALSDATRRGVLEQLGRADASITDLAQTFHMTLTGMRKHVGVLEQAELVTTEKVGRVRTCRLGPRRLEEETAWIERYRQLWDSRFDELDKVVEELKRKEKVDGRNERE